MFSMNIIGFNIFTTLHLWFNLGNSQRIGELLKTTDLIVNRYFPLGVIKNIELAIQLSLG